MMCATIDAHGLCQGLGLRDTGVLAWMASDAILEQLFIIPSNQILEKGSMNRHP